MLSRNKITAFHYTMNMKKVISKNYSIKKNKDCTVLINIYNSEEIYLFENSSKTIIDNIDKSDKEIINIIIQKYNVNKKSAECDYKTFINILVESKILELKDE